MSDDARKMDEADADLTGADNADDTGAEDTDAEATEEAPGEARVLTVPVEWSGYRLDRLLALALPEHSRSLLHRLILSGDVTVDDRTMRPSLKVKEGDTVRVRLPDTGPITLIPEAIPLDIRYEDDQLLVIVKPRGMVTHPAPGSRTGTLVHAVLAHCPESLSRVGGEGRPGIVHRLDKETSGLILVAKTDTAHRSLSRQIQERTAERRYLALVWGEPKFERATVDAAIGRHPAERRRMAVLPLSGPDDPGPRSRAARTELTTLERFGFCALLECRLMTGRTHQIRVHCAHIGHPVMGDETYGGKRGAPPEAFHNPLLRAELNRRLAALQGQALHAYSLAFDHPVTGERLTFTADPPEPFTQTLDLLRDSLRDA